MSDLITDRKTEVTVRDVRYFLPDLPLQLPTYLPNLGTLT